MTRTLLALAAGLSLAAPPALAQAPGPFRDLVHARSLGMGGAYRALGLGLETVTGNPAAMSLYRRYIIELSGLWDFTSREAFGAAGVMDSTNPLAAGVTYHLIAFGEVNDRSLAHLNSLALSIPVTESLHVGASAHYLYATGALRANAVTGDAGVALRLGENLAVAVGGHHLIPTGHPELSTYWTGSASFIAGLVAAAADVRLEPRPNLSPLWGLNVGGEYVMGSGFPVRVGYSFVQRASPGDPEVTALSHFLSAGLGYITEGGGLDVAYRHELTGVGRAVAVTLRIGG
jgi:hypothetical protein